MEPTKNNLSLDDIVKNAVGEIYDFYVTRFKHEDAKVRRETALNEILIYSRELKLEEGLYVAGCIENKFLELSDISHQGNDAIFKNDAALDLKNVGISFTNSLPSPAPKRYIYEVSASIPYFKSSKGELALKNL